MKWFAAAAILFGLAGCTTEGLVSAAYPDREVYRFKNSDQTEVFSYSCAPGETQEATKTRAATAHRYMDDQLNKMATKFADQIMANVEAGTNADIPALTRKLEASAERAAEQTEARYQCLFVDGREI